MRVKHRDGLLILLGIAAGSADGWSYFGLGHAFVANMTGNTVLAGLAVFQRNGDVLHPLISLVCYAAGVALAAFLNRRVRPGSVWPRSISWTLLLEAAALAGAEIRWAAVGAAQQNSDSSGLRVLLGCVAFAIGMQSGAMVQLKIPGIVTTYISGTWTTLMSGFVRVITHQEKQQTDNPVEFEQRLQLQAVILIAYLLSAVMTGWLFRYAPRAVGALPAACITLAAATGLLRNGRGPESQLEL